MYPEIESYRAKLHEAIGTIGICEEEWNNERWAALAMHVTQDYLDTMFEQRVEIAKMFHLTPDHPHHDGYYQAYTRNTPKDANRVKEKLTECFFRIGTDPKGPRYFTAVNDYLTFALPVWDLEGIPSAIEHIQSIAEKQGIVYVQGKDLDRQFAAEEESIASDLSASMEDASCEDVASDCWADEESAPRAESLPMDCLDEEDWGEIVQFVHVYIPKYGLIEFRILHPLAHCIFERISELKNIYFPGKKRNEERRKIWNFYQAAKEFLLTKTKNGFVDESQKQHLQKKVLDLALLLYTDKRGIFRLDMEMRFILNVILEWPLELQEIGRQNSIQV